MNKTDDPIVDGYLRRLEEAAQTLPADRRAELLADVREHLAMTLSERASEAEKRQVLERLGAPEEIVRAAAEDDQPTAAPPTALPTSPSRPPSTRVGAYDLATVLLLFLGGFAVGIGWLVGLVLLWASSTFRVRDKLIGTFFVPGGLALPAFLYFTNAGACEPVPGEPGGGSDCVAMERAMDIQFGVAGITAVLALTSTAYLLYRAIRR